MNLTSVATTRGGTVVSATGMWTLVSPTPRGYERVLYLRFDTQGLIDGLRVDETGCSMQAAFQPYDYNALNAAPIPAAELSTSKDGKAVIVKLDGPREVLNVALTPARTAELHRADGSVQADKAADASGFVDVNFAIQPADGNPIAPSQVASVNLRGTPTNPKIAIANADLSSPAVFWPTPDSLGSLSVNADAAFAKGVAASLAGQWQQALKQHQQNPAIPLPNLLDVALVFRADAPSTVSISSFQVRFHRVLSSFSPGGGERQVLRYGGKRVERHSLFLELPASAEVTSASLRVSESLHSGRVQAATDELIANAKIDQGQGVEVAAEKARCAAQSLTPSTAMTAGGVALGAMALRPGSELVVELQTDRNGAPSGRKIAEGRASLERAGERQWVIVPLINPVALPSEPGWVLIKAAKGSAVWLAEPGANSVRLLEGQAGSWADASRLDGFQALCRFLPPAPAPGVGAGGQTAPASLLLFVGQQKLTPAVQEDGALLFEMAFAVNAYLAAARSMVPPMSPVRVPLDFAAAAAGTIAVYPPDIAYDS